MNNLNQCQVCGGMFPDKAMADWTICMGCKTRQAEKATSEEIYIDNLGITWTKGDIEEAGGINEVKKMAFEADARNNIKKE